MVCAVVFMVMPDVQLFFCGTGELTGFSNRLVLLEASQTDQADK